MEGQILCGASVSLKMPWVEVRWCEVEGNMHRRRNCFTANVKAVERDLGAICHDDPLPLMRSRDSNQVFHLPMWKNHLSCRFF